MNIVEDKSDPQLRDIPIGTLFTVDFTEYYIKASPDRPPVVLDEYPCVDMKLGLLTVMRGGTAVKPLYDAFIALPPRFTLERD